MRRPVIGFILTLVVMSFLGCQGLLDRKADDAEKEALKKRIAQLEQAKAGAGTPTPTPTEAPQRTSAPAARVQKPPTVRPGAAPRRTSSADTTASPSSGAAKPPGEEGPGADFRVAEDRERQRWTLPEGTELTLVLETGLSSETSQAGDRVVARVERAVGDDGRILLPGGTRLEGDVVSARSAGRVSGRSLLAVAFDRIVVRGRPHELETTTIQVEGPGDAKKDAAVVGGSAAAGAVIGGILKGGKGAKKGAVIGALGGAGAVLVTKGREIEVPAGSRWTVTVRKTARIPD